jgi:hypothetical protein
MLRVLGKTKTEDAYRIAIDIGDAEVVALVPDALLSAQYGRADKVPHQAAYEWIETQAHDLVDAIRALHKGARPAARFTDITLDAR